MDMKKKLDQAYMPDKNNRIDKVAVAMSGGIDSFVAAYLLKIQKHELMGITVLTGWEDSGVDEEGQLSCFINSQRLTMVKDFCHQIGIPHSTVKISAEFRERVVESWMADRTFGKLPQPCWSCHEVRMHALYDKMKQLGAKYLATGHFAKLFHHEAHGTTFVHSSNDEHFDQSLLLARLPQDILHSLMLPLSDLQKKEVIKLAENFGLSGLNKKMAMHQCFPWNETSQSFVEKKIPARFMKPGEVVDVSDKGTVSELEKLLPHAYGDLIVPKNTVSKEDLFLVDYNYPEKKYLAGKIQYFSRNRILLTDCEVTEETPWSEPVHASLKVSDDLSVDCWVHPKSLRSAFVEWDEKIDLKEGMIVGVYRKKGKNSKVYVSGKVKFLPEEKVQVEGEKQNAKVDYAVDY
jgi:tRNA-uridine 2-sulfurtransferase